MTLTASFLTLRLVKLVKTSSLNIDNTEVKSSFQATAATSLLALATWFYILFLVS